MGDIIKPIIGIFVIFIFLVVSLYFCIVAIKKDDSESSDDYDDDIHTRWP